MTRIGTGAWLMIERDGKSKQLEVEDLTNKEREEWARLTDSAEIVRWLNIACNTLYGVKKRLTEEPSHIQIGHYHVLLEDIEMATAIGVSENTWRVDVSVKCQSLDSVREFASSETEAHQFARDIMDKVAKHRALR